MEERAMTSHHRDEHEQQKNNDTMHTNNSSTIPTGGPPLRTYIVQIPKDQIYRVPPPEHAEIVERYRNPAKSKRRCTPCMTWSISVLFALAFLITLITCTYHFTLSPKLPTFSVKYFRVKNLPDSTTSRYKISVGTTNPNSNNDIEYSRGNVALIYKENEVGKGYFPPLDSVKGGKTDGVDLALNGPTKKVKTPASLDLKMTIPIKLKTWLFTKNVDVTVDCKFKVNSFENNGKILSESCVY